MFICKRKLVMLGSSAALIFATSTVQAQLSYLGPQYSLAGIGALNTVLTLQAPANSTSESGSVSLDGSGSTLTTGDATFGQLYSLSSLGLTKATDLRLVFNAEEPVDENNGINITNLALSIFSPTGSVLFSSGSFNPVTLTNTFSGPGNTGFVFGLDALQASAAQLNAFSGTFGNNLIGVSASATFANGGPESISVASNVPAVPEPETYALMLIGLGFLGFMTKRRQ